MRPGDVVSRAVITARSRFRRSPFVVLYWRGARWVAHDYARGHVAEISPALATALNACTDWQTIVGLERALNVNRARATDYARVLRSHGFLRFHGHGPHPRKDAMAAFEAWNPAAGLFHDVSRRVRFVSGSAAAALMRRRARESAMPPPVKRLRGALRQSLPRPALEGDFPEVLLGRRTWRRFGSSAVSTEQLATILGLTAGVQQWVPTSLGRLPLKTSPSGGARHPIEAYVCVRRVTGVAPGLYHYASDVHALERLRRGDLTSRVRAWMPHSEYFARAAFIVIFTAVMERELWRYPYARAYRAALAEAGHVCQTFCLTATWQGLAPFCLMGLDDAAIERDLGVDGVRETVLYVAGAGARPRGSTWAPRSRGSLGSKKNPAFTG